MFIPSDRRITYILCTRNKLPQLRCTVPDLIAACRKDDEIVVFDGASTDGSHEYLQSFFEAGKFRVYRSEPDRNQAHALNKALFCARGEFIKVVLDDDVLRYSSMQKCADFMHANPAIDIMGANVGLCGYTPDFLIFRDEKKQPHFERWLGGGEPFWFQDQSFICRRSSLPIIGLWSTGVNCIDVEMTLRLTSLRQVKLAWYTGTVAVHIMTAASLGLNPEYNSRIPADIRRLHAFFGVECPRDWRAPTVLDKIRGIFRLRTRLRALAEKWRPTARIPYPPTFPLLYEECKRWLAENHLDEHATFVS